MPEIAKLIRAERPELADQISTKSMGDWILKIGSVFNRQAKKGNLMLRMNRYVSNQKAKNVLGWQPHYDNREIVLESTDFMVENKLV